MSKFKITTADGLKFDIDSKQIEQMDIVENPDGSFQLIYEGRSYNIDVLEADQLQVEVDRVTGGREDRNQLVGTMIDRPMDLRLYTFGLHRRR